MDAVARLIAPALGAQLGQQVVVENRPGAAGPLAADAMARSPADGYALLLGESDPRRGTRSIRTRQT